MKHGLIVAATLLALTGCNRDAKKDAGTGTAQGEVLPGSASDAMLPFDTVKSQAPLAPKSEGGEPGDTKSAKGTKIGVKPGGAPVDRAVEAKPAPSPSAADTPTPD